MPGFFKIVKYSFAHSSRAWFKQHVNDQFVKKASELNYRSRAAFKLQQIQEKYDVLGKRIIDLGSAPGSWSQFALRYKKQRGLTASQTQQSKVVAVDILEMKPIQGLDFYKCDARDRSLHRMLIEKYGHFDSIISDMAPNFTGVAFETHEEILGLNKMCVKLALQLSHANCTLVMKTTEGASSKVFFDFLDILFHSAQRFKPKASRSQSKQFYYVCKNFRKQYYQQSLKVQQSQQTPHNIIQTQNQKTQQIEDKPNKKLKNIKLRQFINNQLDDILFNNMNKKINRKELKRIIDQVTQKQS